MFLKMGLDFQLLPIEVPDFFSLMTFCNHFQSNELEKKCRKFIFRNSVGSQLILCYFHRDVPIDGPRFSTFAYWSSGFFSSMTFSNQFQSNQLEKKCRKFIFRNSVGSQLILCYCHRGIPMDGPRSSTFVYWSSGFFFINDVF